MFHLSDTEIFFDDDSELSEFCNLLEHHRVSIALVDQTLKNNPIWEKLGPQLPLTHVEYLTANETIKSTDGLDQVLRLLFEKELQKKDALIIVGGGSLSDVVGLAAHIYLRGITLYQIPTTLLSMVDASLGGKNAINTPYGKNTIGAYHAPHANLYQIDFLKTLSDHEYRLGMVEMLKHGLLYSRKYWKTCLELLKTPSIKNSPELKSAVKQSIDYKLHTIRKQEYQPGIRDLLNFGHTVAHAIEQVSGYTISHGQAVATGIVVEAGVSKLRGLLSLLEFEEIRESLRELIPYEALSHLDFKELLIYMQKDKKSIDDEIYLVLIRGIGKYYESEGRFCHPCSEQHLITAWAMKGLVGASL